MSALSMHPGDLWPILAILVIVVLPAAMFLLQASRVRRLRRAAEQGQAAQPGGRIRVLAPADLPGGSPADLALLARWSLTDTLGPAADSWAVEFGQPAAAPPLVVVEIAAPDGSGDTPDRLADALRTRLAGSLRVAPGDIDIRFVRAPA